MGFFRKKPVVIEAFQWFKNGDHPEDGNYPDNVAFKEGEGAVVRYFRDPTVSEMSDCEHCGKCIIVHGWIDTLEGGHIVCPADWIITGVEGERYPIKNGIFLKTYEPVGGRHAK